MSVTNDSDNSYNDHWSLRKSVKGYTIVQGFHLSNEDTSLTYQFWEKGIVSFISKGCMP